MQETHPPEFAVRLGKDHAQLELTERERALLDYADKLTRSGGVSACREGGSWGKGNGKIGGLAWIRWLAWVR